MKRGRKERWDTKEGQTGLTNSLNVLIAVRRECMNEVLAIIALAEKHIVSIANKVGQFVPRGI